ncbi:MAG TPA: D-arabinono-1,4-lactone oxidase [Solirubrobacterales bacterium]|nr:D-arabinono-1,4-lactone oxidase [Solirubrobacterales bacterium]
MKGRRLTFSLRRDWRNDAGNQGIDPLREYEPESLEEIQEIVQEAEDADTTVRAVGSGHSWSDVALAPGFLLRPGGLTRALELEDELMLPSRKDDPPLVRVESGMRIRELNELLDGMSLALPNMGGYDGQTIAGVISTSTHGSGKEFGPFSDLVRSIDLVAAEGTVHRIERASGPTDPAAYAAAHPDRVLRKNDDWFRAAVVSMGCMGVIHSVILAVGPAHYLREVRELSRWSAVRKQIASGEALAKNEHYELLFSPYPGKDCELECLVTTRNTIPPDEYSKDRRRARNWLIELASRFPPTAWFGNLVSGLWPKLNPFLIHFMMKNLRNPSFVNKSYRVLNIGAANYLPALSSEIGVPVDERNFHLRAVDEIVAVAARHRDLGQAYQSAPISLRFVHSTDAFMSMMQGRTTMMIELIMQTHTQGGTELMAAYEDRLYALEGRPHWGQINTLTRDRVAELYPQFANWLEVHDELNSSGVFDGPFSKRLGISAAGSS